MKNLICLSLAIFASTAAGAAEQPFATIVHKLFGNAPASVIRGGGETGQGDGCSFSISSAGNELTVRGSVDGMGGTRRSATIFTHDDTLRFEEAPSTLAHGFTDLTITQGSKTTVITYRPNDLGTPATVNDVDDCGQDM